MKLPRPWIWLFLAFWLSGCTSEIRAGTNLFDSIWDAQARVATINPMVWIIIGLSLLILGYKTYSLWIILLPGIIFGAFTGFVAGQAFFDDPIVIAGGLLLGGMIGWFFFAMGHAITIWGLGVLFTGLACVEALETLGVDYDPAFAVMFGIFGGVILSYIYSRLLGMVAAVIGAAILGAIWGYGGMTIFLVAGVGFFIQWRIAVARGEDIFRRPNYKTQRKAEEAKRKSTARRNEPEFWDEIPTDSTLMEDRPRRPAIVEDFDPNVEMQVYED